MADILIIDDDVNLCRMLQRKLVYLDHQASMAHTLGDGLRCVAHSAFDVVLLDVRLPDGSGLNALSNFQKSPSNPEIIIITGEGDANGAELAIKAGAWDYIEKPIPMGELKLQVTRALQYRREKDSAKLPVALKRDNLVGSSPQIKACLDVVAQSASSNANVFITGETGTGKELFAMAVHENSPCSDANFVVVDCAALPEQLIESMLFGHVKGAFTGADKSQDGLITMADGGTLFLDEVGELPLSIQKRFLRVLQERRYRPVGHRREIESNFRLISATNRDLDTLVREGRFRQDLLFRLRTFSIQLPPLRERREDIKGLLFHHIPNLCNYHGQKAKGYVPEFLAALEAYDWPGNVRELVNTLEKAVIAASTSPLLYPLHLPDEVRLHYLQASNPKKEEVAVPHHSTGPAQASSLLSQFETFPTLKAYREKLLDQGEAAYVGQLLAICDNNILEACKMSGLGKSRLYALIKKHSIMR